VPSPNEGRARLAFRDAGPTGEDVLARNRRGIPAAAARRTGSRRCLGLRRRAAPLLRAKPKRGLGRARRARPMLVSLGADSPPDYAASQKRRAFGDDLASDT